MAVLVRLSALGRLELYVQTRLPPAGTIEDGQLGVGSPASPLMSSVRLYTVAAIGAGLLIVMFP